MKAKQYRVIDREEGNEDLHHLETSATTDLGFMRLFYSRWPNAKRGGFYAEVGDGRIDFRSKASERLVASFIAV